MSKSPRSELLAVQRKLWRWNKKLIEDSINVKEPGFDRYERNYRRAVRDYKRVSNQDEMVRSILSSDIIYVGDYHTCHQSQRSFLRILKAVVTMGADVTIGMELIHRRHQRVLDRYLAGRIKERTFLKRIRLLEHWVFDLWQNFRPLFDFSQYHGIPMVAIDAAQKGATVRQRDRATAELIAGYAERHPRRKLFVFSRRSALSSRNARNRLYATPRSSANA